MENIVNDVKKTNSDPEITEDISMENENPFLLFLAAPTIEDMEKISKGDELMEDIVRKVKKLNSDPKIMEEIAIENEHEIWANTMHSRGLEQGSKNEKIEIAKNMLKKNMDIDTIVEITGLSKEAIEELK